MQGMQELTFSEIVVPVFSCYENLRYRFRIFRKNKGRKNIERRGDTIGKNLLDHHSRDCFLICINCGDRSKDGVQSSFLYL